MSASQEKKNRSEERGAGVSKKQAAADEQALASRRFRRNTILVVAVVAVIAIAAFIINSNLFYTKLTAVTVGDTSYSAAEVDVFYRSTYNNIYSSYEETYGDLVSYIIDTSTALDEQQYSETQTWADYLLEETLSNMQQITALYDAAIANGYTLTEDDEATVADQLSSIELYASIYGMNADQYIAQIYGKGVDSDLLESVLTRIVIAQSYASLINDGFSYTADEKDAYYAEHADELDYISYYYYLVSVDNESFSTLEDDDAKVSAAHEAAEEIVADVSDLDGFIAAAQEFDASAAPSLLYTSGSDLTDYYESYSAWLLDASRTEGDTTVVDTDGGTYALYFVGRDDNDYNVVDMRHILIEVEANEDYEYTEEAQEEALSTLQAIYDEWLTDPTEDYFATLAEENSDDTGSNTNGGLYENVTRHQMVTAIDSFLFEEGAEAGDTAIVFGENGYYQGYHLVYYVGEGAVYRDSLAESALRSADYNAYLDGLLASYDVSKGSGARYVEMS
ncbi:MAG: peptidyl-prolyl cis-trans isomerase [Oscillospiraceae bacterium]|nr:peptidyl-prolyl cis-trans isomerase [Oscillospiraceae bacterium]